MLLAGSLKSNESLTQLVSGLIVVLTFTLAASVATGGGQQGARSALVGAIAANLSWGIINAVMYVMDSAFGGSRPWLQHGKITFGCGVRWLFALHSPRLLRTTIGLFPDN